MFGFNSKVKELEVKLSIAQALLEGKSVKAAHLENELDRLHVLYTKLHAEHMTTYNSLRASMEAATVALGKLQPKKLEWFEE